MDTQGRYCPEETTVDQRRLRAETGRCRANRRTPTRGQRPRGAQQTTDTTQSEPIPNSCSGVTDKQDAFFSFLNIRLRQSPRLAWATPLRDKRTARREVRANLQSSDQQLSRTSWRSRSAHLVQPNQTSTSSLRPVSSMATAMARLNGARGKCLSNLSPSQ